MVVVLQQAWTTAGEETSESSVPLPRILEKVIIKMRRKYNKY
jgi:hypothetical protein